MQQVTSIEEFDNQIKSDKLTVNIFTTTWCPDCKRLDLFIDEIITEHQDKQWFTIDKDELPELAEKENVMGIPSLLVYKNGEKIAHLHSANAKTPDQVRDFLSNF
ncbi:thioredoxin family protein [Pradoshia sp. D12]|uniref:thioredoxin family protein n=1 Tax=Bacillaceae TaxID=186817 RepID=UPI00080AEE41|nr:MULTISPECIES: thioredoxin family protein [Bacillaceae]OCA89521.1 thiol reductase thioredoxin [Bacillus sp. FJAT-27986]QFK71098.1 thioredoxin family protein [Pradoshia sp. D12]TPF72890.1 thioredoxin family protein [Bacillus sp. D12]